MIDIGYCEFCKVMHHFCNSCHIGIGGGHFENYVEKVSSFELCGSCYALLRKKGKIKLNEYPKTIKWLLPNGETKTVPIEGINIKFALTGGGVISG